MFRGVRPHPPTTLIPPYSSLIHVAEWFDHFAPFRSTILLTTAKHKPQSRRGGGEEGSRCAVVPGHPEPMNKRGREAGRVLQSTVKSSTYVQVRRRSECRRLGPIPGGGNNDFRRRRPAGPGPRAGTRVVHARQKAGILNCPILNRRRVELKKSSDPTPSLTPRPLMN